MTLADAITTTRSAGAIAGVRDSGDTTTRVRVLTLTTILAVATLLAYENSFRGTFVFDDLPTIVENESIRSFRATWEAGPEEIPVGLKRRPVGRWSLAFSYAVGGFRPANYHLFNLAVHITAGALLFGIVRRTLMLNHVAPFLRRSAAIVAYSAALIWLVHPLQTESVTYLIQRLESLMGMFFLACVYCALRGSQSRWPLGWYTAAIVACWLGLGTKEVMFTAPLVVLLFDRTLLASSWPELLRKRWLLYAVLAASMIVYFVVAIQRVPYYAEPPDAARERATSWEYLRTQPGVLLHYLRLTIWPVGQSLDLLWQVTHDPLEIYGKGAVILGMLIGSFVLLFRRHWIGLAGLSFFVILAPSSTIVPLHLAFEHRMYLSLACVVVPLVIGLFTALGWLARRFGWSTQTAEFGLLAVVTSIAVALGLATHARNDLYHDAIAIWQNVVSVNPRNARGHMNLANELVKAGRFDEARRYYQLAVAVKPDYAQCYNNIGIFLQHFAGETAEALPHYRKAAELNPKNSRYRFSVASALEFLDQTDEAEESYRQAIELDPAYGNAYHNLGRLLRRRKQYDEAEAMFQMALRNDCEIWKTHQELGRLYAATDRTEKAIASFETALQLDANPMVQRELAWLLATSSEQNLRDGNRAVTLAEAASQMLDKDPDSWTTLAAAYAEAGRFDNARQSAQKALEFVDQSPENEGGAKSAQEIQRQISLYEAGQPYGNPVSETDPNAANPNL